MVRGILILIVVLAFTGCVTKHQTPDGERYDFDWLCIGNDCDDGRTGQ